MATIIGLTIKRLAILDWREKYQIVNLLIFNQKRINGKPSTNY